VGAAGAAAVHDPAALEASGIEKTFGSTRALQGASLSVVQGEVHALLGANGAGKSTLARVISGHLRPDRGRIAWRGRPLAARSPRDALSAGIALVTQETSLAPDLSVLENIFLPELGLPGRLSRSELRRRAADLLTSLGQQAALPLDAAVRSLSSAQRQLVEIAKALALRAQLLIFDEPTASLSPGEVERLFDIIATLRSNGSALVFVSHRLEEVFAITDRVTVMREGRTVAAALDTLSLTQSDIIRHMAGQDVAIDRRRSRPIAAADRPVVLEVAHLQAPPAVRDVSFALRAGEILGLGGLVGAGRSETVEAIFGLRPRTGGRLTLSGQAFDPNRPADAVRAGLGLVPEDRRTQSIVPDFSVRENLLLGHLSAHRGLALGYAQRGPDIAALLDRLGLPAHRLLDASMLNFSGGMQQKIIFARWLLLKPKVLILDEPTKGVDIATRAEIYCMLRDVAADGASVLLVSSDFEELLTLSDRVVVVSDGVAIAELPANVLDEEKLTLLAAPRSSRERTAAILRDLTAAYGGSAFYTLLDADRLFCLDCIVADPAADPGFRAGDAPEFAASAIAPALEARSNGFTVETGRSTLLVQVRSHRGHDLGWIGICLAATTALPDAAPIRERIQTQFARAI
jgi:ribose transport system ATP-binding protein/rhamnose transport system ATP-binding protein